MTKGQVHPMPRTILAELVLEPDRAGVARSRRVVADALSRLGYDDAVGDAELVVSELVTNAIVHGRSRVGVCLVLTDEGVLRLEISDEGDGRPRVLHPGSGAEHGRGLMIVERLSLNWGVNHHPHGGKTIWTDLRC